MGKFAKRSFGPLDKDPVADLERLLSHLRENCGWCYAPPAQELLLNRDELLPKEFAEAILVSEGASMKDMPSEGLEFELMFEERYGASLSLSNYGKSKLQLAPEKLNPDFK